MFGVWIKNQGTIKPDQFIECDNAKDMTDKANAMIEDGYLPIQRTQQQVILVPPDNPLYREKVYDNVCDLIYEYDCTPLEALCLALSQRMGLSTSDGIAVAEWIYSRRISPQAWNNYIKRAKQKLNVHLTEH